MAAAVGVDDGVDGEELLLGRGKCGTGVLRKRLECGRDHVGSSVGRARGARGGGRLDTEGACCQNGGGGETESLTHAVPLNEDVSE
ncbi:hypothetical protein NPS01_06780 [Nocardioides psychrotolerans]|nr:hypothetical protein NPS01_06780 [Nocardioides psychrotolerans]